MAEIKWCSQEDVEKRLAHIQTAKSHNPNDIGQSIVQAVDRARPVMISRFGADQVNTWTDEMTVPRPVREYTANYAGAMILQNNYGESVTDRLVKAGSLYAIAEKFIQEVKDRIIELEEISDVEDQVASSTANRTKTFSMTHPSDDDFGDGSLDGL